MTASGDGQQAHGAWSGHGDRNDHDDVDCREVLTEVYLYLDLECSEHRRQMIRQHLEECRPCLREYGIEQEVKALVGRCCGQERAPAELVARLRAKLTELVVDVEASREPG